MRLLYVRGVRWWGEGGEGERGGVRGGGWWGCEEEGGEEGEGERERGLWWGWWRWWSVVGLRMEGGVRGRRGGEGLGGRGGLIRDGRCIWTALKGPGLKAGEEDRGTTARSTQRQRYEA